MGSIILVDMRESNGEITAIEKTDGTIAQFDTKLEAARNAVRLPILESHPYAILDLDEIFG